MEAPTTEKEMETICREAPGHHLANMLEDPASPSLSNTALEAIGSSWWRIRLSCWARASVPTKKALEILEQNGTPEDRVSFQELKEDVGFDEYHREEERYSDGE